MSMYIYTEYLNMSDEKIIKYYLLCTIRAGSKKHLFSDITDRDKGTIITKKELLVYFKLRDGDYIAKETIVGGSSTKAVIIC
jgi:hypothetical protein